MAQRIINAQQKNKAKNMKRIILTTGLVIMGITGAMAQKYMTRTGKISFDATAAKSPEKIYAINNEVACIVDGATGEIVFQLPVKSFKFEKALMQEHFNENYVESDKYPRSEFKGSISNIKDVHLDKDGTYNATVSGKLTMHGETKDVTSAGTVTVKGGNVTLSAKFKVKLADYKIDVPSMVSDKVGKEATITVDCSLVKK